MNKTRKLKQLNAFFEKYKYLPCQNSKQWLEERKFFIGGSEMGTIAGTNPYKDILGLIKGHLGIEVFSGNINTYWGSILEDYTVQILETKWNCDIKETGSLPGVIPEQKYSPDGLVYLEFLDQIVLLEIKNAIRRVANGKVPAPYKSQIYTGLDTIPIADRALFIDSMFRRCSLVNYNFTNVHDTAVHPKKPVDDPILLCAIFIYEDKYSGYYDNIKEKYGKLTTDSFIDGGICEPTDLEQLLSDVLGKKLIRHFPKTIDKLDDNTDYKSIMVNNFLDHAKKNDYTAICIIPLKLFKFEIIPVERNDWKKKYNRSTRTYIEEEKDYENYVESHANTIKQVISQIKELDKLPKDKMLERLDEMYPRYDPEPHISDEMCEDIIKSIMC
jgi:hypothetical protein